MDQQQTQQTEQIITEMLEFLETSSEDENDLDQKTRDKFNEMDNSIKNDNIFNENTKNTMKTKKEMKAISFIAKELKKLRQVQGNCKEIENNHQTKNILNYKIQNELPISSEFENLDWQYKLENHCRRNFGNIFTQEVYKAIYQDTTGHPSNGSLEYYQAAQNYVLYGKHFLDFPKNFQILLSDKSFQSSLAEGSNLMPNFYNNCTYSKPNTMPPNVSTPVSGGPTTAASAYYQICNNVQAQTRSALATNPGNSTAYGIFMGNKVTYMAGTPTTHSLIYNQHNTTTTNFISNSLANAALASSPTILYTNPLLTTTTQQYLTQFLSAAALTSNSNTVSANAGAGTVYERLIYAQMLQQQLYQTQMAAAVPAMFQNKHRAVNPVARQTANILNVNSNRSSPQHLTAAPIACNLNGITLNTCNRQARSTSPSELAGLKSQSPITVAIAETSDNSKITSV